MPKHMIAFVESLVVEGTSQKSGRDYRVFKAGDGRYPLEVKGPETHRILAAWNSLGGRRFLGNLAAFASAKPWTDSPPMYADAYEATTATHPLVAMRLSPTDDNPFRMGLSKVRAFLAACDTHGPEAVFATLEYVGEIYEVQEGRPARSSKGAKSSHSPSPKAATHSHSPRAQAQPEPEDDGFASEDTEWKRGGRPEPQTPKREALAARKAEKVARQSAPPAPEPRPQPGPTLADYNAACEAYDREFDKLNAMREALLELGRRLGVL